MHISFAKISISLNNIFIFQLNFSETQFYNTKYELCRTEAETEQTDLNGVTFFNKIRHVIQSKSERTSY